MPNVQSRDTNFPIRIESSLGSDLLVESATGEEHLGKPFEFHLSLLSENKGLNFDKVVGQKVTVIIELLNEKRYFHGYITEFCYEPPREGFARYEATVRPWFWFLTQTSDCRIFQGMTVPDILKLVFKDNGMSDHDFDLRAKYRKWDYCVQYRESDFNFLSRLMEQEGIYYYFEHEKDKHVMMIRDENSTHESFLGYDKVSYLVNTDLKDTAGNLDFWSATQSITPSKYAIKDFDFKNLGAKLLAQLDEKNQHASPLGDPEIFDYPGEYSQTSEGNDYVKVRLQELRCQQERRQGGGTCRGIAVGHTFTLEDHFRDDQNKEYLVVSMIHNLVNAPFLSTTTKLEEEYLCKFEVIEKSKQFRTARHTPKPVVQGPQTAIIVGKTGEEIYTDEFGRVKVLFHWDRGGHKDKDKSDAGTKASCWIRVSQAWAGEKWGTIHIPRMGQEVIVSFMEGDPDRPIITGRVYNADQKPPYTLPDNKTQSGIKSRSTKGGTSDNFNEIRMEDKIGGEELYIHAEKDQNNVVENDETTNVGNDRTEDVVNDETIKIGNNRKEEVVVDETIKIGGNRKEDVDGNETITIKGKRTETVDKDETITIKGKRTETVTKDETITIKGKRTETVTKDEKIKISGKKFDDVKGAITTKSGKAIAIKAGSTMLLEAKTAITLKVGSTKIKIAKAGITITGAKIELKGKGKVEAKAAMVKIAGSAATVIKGGIVKIN